MGRAPDFLKGVFAPVTTPFVDGRPSLDNLQRNIQMYLTSPLDGFVVLGSTGEFPLLRFEEKLEIIAAAVEAAEERPVLAGTGCPSTAETIELTHAAAERGARAALVIAPYYFRRLMDADALREHYTAVADASPIPVLIYHFPQNTGVELPVDLVLELADHPNLVGLKDSSEDLVRFGLVAASAPEGFALMVGSAALLLPALVLGAAGGILAFADVAPWECCEIYRLYREGRWAEAQALQRRVTAVAGRLARYGVPGIKALMDLQGYFGGEPRPPLLPLAEDERDAIRGLLKEHRLLGC